LLTHGVVLNEHRGFISLMSVEMALPTFFVIGAAKSGSTSLCALLDQHRQIYISKPKEPRYFAFSPEQQAECQAWYQGLFEGLTDSVKAIGEGSQAYTMRPAAEDWPVPSRIAHAVPGAKLIYIVRNPIDRLVSNWKMMAREKPEVFADFNRDIVDPAHRRLFVDRSKYWFQISAYREFFPDAQIKIVFFEDFIAHPNEVLGNCTRFLGVEDKSDWEGVEKPRNAAPAYRERPLLSAIANFPGLRAALRRLPPALRIAARPIGWQSVNPDIRVKPSVNDSLVSELEEDMQRFLAYAGKPANFWTLERG